MFQILFKFQQSPILCENEKNRFNKTTCWIGPRFDGVPVLYLPGNAGSHMQARSLASVALRKALSHGYEFHFDFFTGK